MRYCPNAACPYAVRFKRPTEFRDDTVTCNECGTALVDTPPAAPAKVERPPAPSSDALGRLLFSAGAVLVTLGAAKVPLLGAPSSLAGEHPRDVLELGLFSIGLTPFISAFLFVEVFALLVPALRQRRVGSAKQRAPLVTAALICGLAFLLVQVLGIVRFLGTTHEIPVPPPELLWPQLVGGHLALAGLALAVSRWGLGNGFVVVGAASTLSVLFGAGRKLWNLVRTETVAPGPLLLVLALVVGVVVVVVRLSVASRRWSPHGPKSAPFPIAPLGVFTLAVALLSLPATLGFSELTRALQSSAWVYDGLAGLIALGLTLVFGWLFFRPEAVGRLWTRWRPELDEAAVVEQARKLFGPAMFLAVLVSVGVPVVFSVVPMLIGVSLAVSVMVVADLALIALDLVEEVRARRRLGRLVAVRPLHRMAEIEPVLAVLEKAGIEAYAQHAAWRAGQQFFGPQAPVMILVPVANADEARSLVDVDKG